MSRRVRPQNVPNDLKAKARQLRREATFPERRLWSVLRNRQMMNLKFRRQQVIGNAIVDFYCDELKLAIEVDGESHVGRAEEDALRTNSLENRAVHVMRFTNDDVLKHLDAVYEAIECEAKRIVARLKPPHPRPLSQRERGVLRNG